MVLSSLVMRSFIKGLSRAVGQQEGHQQGTVKYFEASTSKKLLFLGLKEQGEGSVGGAHYLELLIQIWLNVISVISLKNFLSTSGKE